MHGVQHHPEKMSRRHWAAFSALMLTVACFFWRHLFTTDVLFYRDISYAHYPRAVELRAIVHSGLLPLWNPFEHFGESVISNPNYLLFYPTTWLAWVLPPTYGFKLHYVLHFFLLAAGAFLLARRIGLGPPACYLAGALFVFSGPVMSLGNFYNMLPAAAWMPLVILAADYQMRRGGWLGAAVFSGALTMQFLAGEPLTGMATVGLALGWALAFYADWRGPIQSAVNRVLAGRFLLGLLLTTGLSAVQLLPVLVHLGKTQRSSLRFEAGFYWSLHPLKLLDVLLPRFWGDALSHWHLPWLYLDGREPLLLSLFIGIIPLGLALVAVVVRRDHVTHLRATRFWGVAGVLALLSALGSFTPFCYVLYYVLPVFQIVRFPVKLLVPVALAVSQLAAIGSHYLAAEKPAERQARRLLWLGGAVVTLGLVWLLLAASVRLLPDDARQAARGLAAAQFQHDFVLNLRQVLEMNHAETVERAALWRTSVIPQQLPYVLLPVLLIATIVFCRWPSSSGANPWLIEGQFRLLLIGFAGAVGVLLLMLNHRTVNPVADRRFFEDRPPVLEKLRGESPPLRVFAEPDPVVPNLASPFLFRNPREMDFLPAAAQLPDTLRQSLQISAGALGVENSYTADPEILLPKPQALLNNLVYLQHPPNTPLARLLSIGSVEFSVLRLWEPKPDARFALAGTFPNETRFPVKVYRVMDVLPRAYLIAAHRAELLPAEESSLFRLATIEFDPTTQVILERTGRNLQESPGLQVGEEEPAGEARILHRDALRVVIETVAAVPAYLVLTDSYNEEWQVSVDGRPVPLLRANLIFRAVRLDPGSHRVTFRYRPTSLYGGALITLVTAAAIGLLIWRRR